MDQTTLVLFKLSVGMIGVSVAVMAIGLRLSGSNSQRARKKGRMTFVMGLLAALVFMVNAVALLGLAIFMGDPLKQIVIYATYFLFATGCALVAISLVVAGKGVFRIIVRIDPPEGDG